MNFSTRTIRLYLCVLLAVTSAQAAQKDDDDELARLIKEIATGDRTESAEAAEELIDRWIGPIATAIGSIEQRPVDQKRRLYDVLSRLSAALRVRIFRAELPTEDRRLFDVFHERFPELVERLFHDSIDIRLAALAQIPIAPGTGAAVLAAGKVLFDNHVEMVEAALELCERFHDPVVARGLARFVDLATHDIKAGIFKAGERTVELVIATYVERAIVVLGDCGWPDAVPAINAALAYFPHSVNRAFWDIGNVAEALGKLGDERAVQALLKYLDDPTARRVQSGARGIAVRQTAGDAVLLSLLKIYKLDANAFGIERAAATSQPFGFSQDAGRAQAVLRFRKWHKRNAGREPEQRDPSALDKP